jgi:AcrR family transcriptional regulator
MVVSGSPRRPQRGALTRAGRRQTAAERSRAATRARLLASGKALFADKGLHGVTSHDIAAHAGVAAGTFYNHFRDKGDLFREITAHALAALRHRIQMAASGKGPHSPRDAVRARTDALLAFAEDERDVIRILFSHDGEAAALEADVLAELAGDIAENRSNSILSGEMPPDIDPTVLSQAVVGLWSRVLVWWAEDPARAPRARVLESLIHIQLFGTHPG